MTEDMAGGLVMEYFPGCLVTEDSTKVVQLATSTQVSIYNKWWADQLKYQKCPSFGATNMIIN